MERVFGYINIIYGCLVTALAAFFGDFWFLFMAFLGLNIIDYITGILKAKHTNKENSNKGAKGIIKKVGYWIVIAIAFFISVTFVEMGRLIGLDLSFVIGFGWLTLATFIINEIRSILENLIILGVQVPQFLIKGLEIIDTGIKDKTGGQDDEG